MKASGCDAIGVAEAEELADADVVVVLDVLADLRSRVVDDPQLAHFHQHAVSSAAADKDSLLRLSSELSVLFAWFLQRWLKVASVDDEERPRVEQMWEQIKRRGAGVLWERDPVLIRDTIKVVRSHPRFDGLVPIPKQVLRQGPNRVVVTPRGTTREAGSRRSRTRARASAGRDGPSSDDDADADPVGRATRGRRGVVPWRARP